MLRKLVAAAAITTTLGLAACQSGPTPYQPGAGYQGGYTESRLENDRYRVSFKGNSLTNRETVENYLLFRAAELTLQNGYDTFTIVNRDTDKDSRLRSSGAPMMYSRLSYTYYPKTREPCKPLTPLHKREIKLRLVDGWVRVQIDIAKIRLDLLEYRTLRTSQCSHHVRMQT